MNEDFSDTDGLMAQMLAITSTDLFGSSRDLATAEARLAAGLSGCANCKEQKACRSWVESHSDQRRPAPDFCQNRTMFGPSVAHF